MLRWFAIVKISNVIVASGFSRKYHIRDRNYLKGEFDFFKSKFIAIYVRVVFEESLNLQLQENGFHSVFHSYL